MATDCQWQRGESWRKNSGKWGSQGWGDSSSQCPPSMPQPPAEPQENLSRKSSIVNQEATKSNRSNSRPWIDKEKPDSGKKVSLLDTNYKVHAPDYMKDWYDPLTGEERKENRYCDEWNDEVIEKPKQNAMKSKSSQPSLKKTTSNLKKHEPDPAKEMPKLRSVSKSQPTPEKESTLNQPVASKKSSEPSKHNETKSGAPLPPPAPPLPTSLKAPPPPPPPPPSLGKEETRPLTEAELKLKKARQNMVEKIKKASRVRPDWQSVMKDIEGGIKLRKVDSCDKLDRSNPILPSTREKSGKFLYESEKPILQNELLNEIHRGIKLRHVRTNDRSKPDFCKLGLRKLRRQLTNEEKKKMDPDNPETLPSSSDEEEDIDKMRDDLVATKSQLANEIKKNKKIETEHKILKIDIESLRAEVKKMKRKLREAGIQEVKPLGIEEAQAIGPKLSKSMSKLRMREEEMDYSELDVIEEDIKILNDEIEAQKKRAEKAEQKCEELKLKLQVASNSAEEWEMRSIYFEKKYKQLQKDIGIELPDINCVGVQCDSLDIGAAKSESTGGILAKKSASRKTLATSFARMESFKEEDESEEETTSSSEDDSSESELNSGEDEQQEEQQENRVVVGENGKRESENREENNDQEYSEQYEQKEDEEAKRIERDFIMWKSKLSHMKDKEKNVRKERNNLRERIRKYYRDMRAQREEYLQIKAELEELSDQMKEGVEEEIDEEDKSSDDGVIRSGNPQIPIQFRTNITKPSLDEESEEEITDFSGLETPEWDDSEGEISDIEEDETDPAKRLIQIQGQAMKHENKTSEIKKDTYKLKAQLNNCEELLTEEKWRHDRLQNELQMLLSDL